MHSMKYFKNSGDHGARHEVQQSFTKLVGGEQETNDVFYYIEL